MVGHFHGPMALANARGHPQMTYSFFRGVGEICGKNGYAKARNIYIQRVLALCEFFITAIFQKIP